MGDYDLIFNLRNCITGVRYLYYGLEWNPISLFDPQQVPCMIPRVNGPSMNFLCDPECVGVPICGVGTYFME